MPPRIVSLLASATETIYALGMGRFLVGRSHECDYPPEVERLPVLTGPRIDVSGNSRAIDEQVREVVRRGEPVYWINAELLRLLRPTVIVTQDHCEVCAVSLRDVQQAICTWNMPAPVSDGNEIAASFADSASPESTPNAAATDGATHQGAGHFPTERLAVQDTEELPSGPPTIVALKPHSLADVWQGMLDIGNALGASEKAEQLVARLKQRMQQVNLVLPRKAHRPTVICLEWLDPLMGAGNWMPELVHLAGGVPVLDEAGRPSAYLRYQDLVQADPEVIILIPCGWDMQRSLQEIHVLERLPGWQHLYAVRHRQVFVADGNQYFNRPGPRLAESVEILAEMLHPDRLAFGHRGHAWQSVYQV